jgi:hypothetical protein
MNVCDMLMLKEVLRPRRRLLTVHLCKHPAVHGLEIRMIQLAWAFLWTRIGFLPVVLTAGVVVPGQLGFLAMIASTLLSLALLPLGWSVIRGYCTPPCTLEESWR